VQTERRQCDRLVGFDFTFHMRCFCEDMVERTPELNHIDMSRVAVSFSQARTGVDHGMYASLTPLRFRDGKRQTIRRGRLWGVQRVVDSRGHEMLYILSFYLPRFLQRPFREKLCMVMHELWHIGPRFDGDLRRYAGRCYAHGAAGQHEAPLDDMIARWFAKNPPKEVYDFLYRNYQELSRKYGVVYGSKWQSPKLVPLDQKKAE